MKTLRIVIGVLLALIVLYLVLCLAGPKKVNVTRTAEIGAPASVIYGYLFDFREWKKWSPWQLKDATIQNTYTGSPTGVGAVNSWTSEHSGSGSQEITDAEIPTLLKTKLQFNDWDGYSIATFYLEEMEGCKTKVSWSMEGDTEVPFFFRAMMIFMNRSVGSDYSDGLHNLKSLSEEQMANLPNSYRGITIEEADFPARTIAGIRQRVNTKDLSDFFRMSYGGVNQALQGAGLTPAGAPVALYYERDEPSQKTDLLAGIPVNSAANLPGVELVELGATKALVAEYTGSFGGSARVHFAMGDYLRERCLVQKNPVIEEYLTDPQVESDTSKWTMRIYYFFE